jgi:hypothetical protein
MQWEVAARKRQQLPPSQLFDLGGGIPTDSPPNKKILQLHKDLYKAESAILVQACTDNIGLAEFLYTRKVPGIETAQCSCGQGEETARHVALFCSKEIDRRPYLRTKGRVNYKYLTGTREGAKLFSAWLICTGRLGQFSLANRLLYS